ncbi:hypothetical protein AG1IA_03947 [Rhizoctonia solani AG-1 IA]|uniref:Uncharacterized protein n=1 Tax=Thanatephorus cucumeris (strain AG1-IA) TaxID=983506 RepID=L8X078_THACA|nr:hypothetical protein AG1IA_03947 [Rhizoctonia solani AG-1 IA]
MSVTERYCPKNGAGVLAHLSRHQWHPKRVRNVLSQQARYLCFGIVQAPGSVPHVSTNGVHDCSQHRSLKQSIRIDRIFSPVWLPYFLGPHVCIALAEFPRARIQGDHHIPQSHYHRTWHLSLRKPRVMSTIGIDH